jgi:hypothetical protein
MLQVTSGKYDYLFLDFLINNSILQETDEPVVTIKHFLERYEIDFTRAKESIDKLISKGVIRLLGATNDVPKNQVTQWRVAIFKPELEIKQTAS